MKTPDGRRVVITVRVDETTASRIDAARGEQNRSAWIRGLITQALTPQEKPCKPYTETQGCKPECKHPKDGVIKGRCTRCRTFVGFSA